MTFVPVVAKRGQQEMCGTVTRNHLIRAQFMADAFLMSKQCQMSECQRISFQDFTNLLIHFIHQSAIDIKSLIFYHTFSFHHSTRQMLDYISSQVFFVIGLSWCLFIFTQPAKCQGLHMSRSFETSLIDENKHQYLIGAKKYSPRAFQKRSFHYEDNTLWHHIRGRHLLSEKGIQQESQFLSIVHASIPDSIVEYCFYSIFVHN
jgi:hypothetical protein